MRFYGIHDDFDNYRSYAEKVTEILFSDLRGCDLRGLDLSSCTFFGCRLDSCDFTDSILEGCRFEYCIIAYKEKMPIFGSSLMDIEVIDSNFYLTDDGDLDLWGVQPFISIVDNIRLIEQIEHRKPNQPALPKEEMGVYDIQSLEETFAYAHLFSNKNISIQSLLYHIYEKIALNQNIKKLSGERYNDIYVFFLTQFRETYIEQDIAHFFEANLLPLDDKIPLKVVKRIFYRIYSPVASYQYLGLLGMRKYHAHHDIFMDIIPKEKLFSMVLLDEDVVRKEAYWMILKVMDFYLVEGEGEEHVQLEKKLQHYLMIALNSPIMKVQLEALAYLQEQFLFFDEEDINQLKNIRDNHEDEWARESAKTIIENYKDYAE